MEGCQLDKSALYSPSISMLVLQNIYKQLFRNKKYTQIVCFSNFNIHVFAKNTKTAAYNIDWQSWRHVRTPRDNDMWAHVWNRSTLLSQFQWSSTHEKMIRQRFKVPLWWFHSPPSSPFRQHSSCTISARFRSCEELWTLHWQYQLRTRCLQQQHNTMTMAGNKSLVRERHNGVIVALWRNRGGSLWPPNPTSSVCECVCVWDAETSCVISKVEHDSSY